MELPGLPAFSIQEGRVCIDMFDFKAIPLPQPKPLKVHPIRTILDKPKSLESRVIDQSLPESSQKMLF